MVHIVWESPLEGHCGGAPRHLFQQGNHKEQQKVTKMVKGNQRATESHEDREERI